MEDNTNIIIETEEEKKKRKRRQTMKDFFFIFFGIFLYAFGFTAFILPEKVVMGGVSGAAALIYYAFNIPPAFSIWTLNFAMLAVAYRQLSKQFVVRTVVGVTMISLLVGALQPVFEAFPIITPGEDKFMHVLIGGALGGMGLGFVFSHNGSTGGTDILVALLNKFFRMSFGRAMQMCDFCIIGSSYFLFKSAETIVYGVAFTMIAAYMCDYIINGARQTVQFFIISQKHAEIADKINKRLHRGATVINGVGWYSKHDVQILMVLARKYESQELFNYIKSIDPNALVSQTFCQGVFGEGFDKMK